MFPVSTIFTLRKTSIASIIMFSMLAMFGYACLNQTPNTTPNHTDEYAIAASYMPDQGFVSLNERILSSTIIARATLRSASAYAHGTGTPKRYSPMIKFTFDD